jgi:hypothetical protein
MIFFFFFPDFTPQEDVFPDSCGCDHWDNSYCNHHNTTREVAVHRDGHIVILLILYGLKMTEFPWKMYFLSI